jgi:hypothetical protein
MKLTRFSSSSFFLDLEISIFYLFIKRMAGQEAKGSNGFLLIVALRIIELFPKRGGVGGVMKQRKVELVSGRCR